MKFLQNFPKRQNLYFLTSETDDFEKTYLTIREQEGRLYDDETVKQLPHLPRQHPQFKEWNSRKWNTQRLLEYLAKENPTYILDLGCGNGWCTHQLAARTNANVLGVDINAHELFQASRLFTNDFCKFAYGDIFQDVFPKEKFDTIILNSCIQYFPDLNKLIKQLQSLLQPNGTIHILDSPIYPQKKLAKARQRSKDYYQEQGIEKMVQHYFHHTWEHLQQYFYKILYHPNTFQNRIRRKIFGQGTPFPWIIIMPNV